MKKSFLISCMIIFFLSTQHQAVHAVDWAYYLDPREWVKRYTYDKVVAFVQSPGCKGAAVGTCSTIVLNYVLKMLVPKKKPQTLKEILEKKKDQLPPTSFLSITAAAFWHGFWLNPDDQTPYTSVIQSAFKVALFLSIVYTIYQIREEHEANDPERAFGIKKHVVNGIKQTFLNAFSYFATHLITQALNESPNPSVEPIGSNCEQPGP